MASYSSVTRFLLVDTPYYELALWLPYVPLISRKAILTLCRTQSPYWKEATSRCWSRLYKDLQIRIFNPTSKRDVNLFDLLQNYPFESSVYSGLLSALVRSAPLDITEATHAKQDAFEKELFAAITPSHPECYEWQAILSHDFRIRSTTRFHRLLPNCVSVYHEVYTRLNGAVRSIRDHIFMPDFSTKTLGSTATRILASSFPWVMSSSEHWGSTQGLEWLYSRTGDRSCGPTEMRSSWKYTELKPRVYYARGPDQYYASRYIQEVFNYLIDSLPITDRFLRFYHAGIRVEPDETLFIYDYSSFTSRLDEVKCFLRSLAVFCSGRQVIVMDTFQGLLNMDLGEMLNEYVDACNDFPLFDISKWPEESVEGDTLRMHTTGMLGVPGNITSCTLLHGIHLAIILESLIKGKCVGDDAIGAKEVDTIRKLEIQVCGLGDVSMTKGATWERDDDLGADMTWNYVKRPINRMDGRIAVGELLAFPTIPGFFNLNDGIHTHLPMVPEELGKKQANALWSLCRSADRLDRILTEEEEDLLDNFIYVFGKLAVTTLHPKSRSRAFVYPKRFEQGLWKKSLAIDIWDRVVLIPKGDIGDWSNPEILYEIEEEVRSNRAMKIASSLGWIKLDALYDEVMPSMCPERFDAWLSGLLRPHYRIFVFRNCPSWLIALMNGHADLTVAQLASLYEVDVDDTDM